MSMGIWGDIWGAIWGPIWSAETPEPTPSPTPSPDPDGWDDHDYVMARREADQIQQNNHAVILALMQAAAEGAI